MQQKKFFTPIRFFAQHQQKDKLRLAVIFILMEFGLG